MISAQAHYLKDADGNDIYPHDEHDDHEDHHDGDDSGSSSRRPKAWRLSMGASVIVLMCILIGVGVLQIPIFGKRNPVATKCMAALASGALLALAAFLVLFEAVHLIQARWKEETQASWRFGALLVSGFTLGCFSDLILRPTQDDDKEDCKDDEEKAVLRKKDVTLVFSIFAGDFQCRNQA